jgi:hypothetical protein
MVGHVAAVFENGCVLSQLLGEQADAGHPVSAIDPVVIDARSGGKGRGCVTDQSCRFAGIVEIFEERASILIELRAYGSRKGMSVMEAWLPGMKSASNLSI